MIGLDGGRECLRLVGRRQARRHVLDHLSDAGPDFGAVERRQLGGRLRELDDRPALEGVQVVDGLNGIAAARVHREHRTRRLLRDTERRTQVRDAADAGEHVCHLGNAAIGERQPVHVADAARIADEIQAVPVGTPLRVDVLGAGQMRQLPDLAAVRVDDRDLIVAVR